MENQIKSKSATIDEALIMSIMAGEKETAQPQNIPPNVSQEMSSISQEITASKDKVKRKPGTDYEKTFFKNADTAARNGKSVYIRPEFHERLCRIIQVIGEDKLTIYAYLDNLLEHHFHEFGDQITTSFNNKYKPIL